jgi:hypothetical protein
MLLLLRKLLPHLLLLVAAACAASVCCCCCVQGKGVDTIACISVNDAFVMDAWGKSVAAGDKVLMLADGNGQFAKALGVELDLTDKGLGVRSRRYALLADDLVGWGMREVCVCWWGGGEGGGHARAGAPGLGEVMGR